MKKILFITVISVIAMAVIVTGCNNNNGLSQFKNVSVEKKLICLNNEYLEKDDTIFIELTFEAMWPEIINGKNCDALQQALLDAISDSAHYTKLTDNAIDKIIKMPLNGGDFIGSTFETIESLPETINSYASNLLVLRPKVVGKRLIAYEIASYYYFCTDGSGSSSYVTFDFESDKAVAMNDIIADNNLLRKVIKESIEDFTIIKIHNLYDQGTLLLPEEFYIDEQRLHVLYQTLNTSYIGEMIDIPVSIGDDEANRLLTPYGQELLGFNKND